MIDPVIQCSVRDLDLCLTQLPIKLRSAPEELDHATHIHFCVFHGDAIPSVRCLCVQQKRRTIFKYAFFVLLGKDLREIAISSEVV